MKYERWMLLMAKLNFSDNKNAFEDLIKAYSETHRHYHNISHIADTLKHLDSSQTIAENPIEIELALWFHDAVYKPFSSTNEWDSAKWAIRFLKENQRAKNISEKVKKLIMATCHSSKPESIDEQLIVDIDLAILGSSESSYARFEENVRKEYKWVPTFIYRKKRKELLNHFLDRDRIFYNKSFFDTFEKQARANISRVLSTL